MKISNSMLIIICATDFQKKLGIKSSPALSAGHHSGSQKNQIFNKLKAERGAL